MDGNFGLDLDTVIHHVENADTFSIFFPILRRALVVDLREAPGQGPLIRVMPMARSAADRIRSLKRQRPQLPRPTEVIAIPWATYVENVVSSGVWGRLLRRLESGNREDAIRTANACLEDLRRYERHEIGALIRGDQYQTIWARKS